MRRVRQKSKEFQLVDKDLIYHRHSSHVRSQQDKRFCEVSAFAFNPYGSTERFRSHNMGVNTCMPRQAIGISDSRTVLYKRGQIILPKDYFIVEISTEGEKLTIAAFSVTSSESYLLY